MRIAAGMDGGGTGTTLELRTTDGTFLERKRFGPLNVNSIGSRQALERLGEIFAYIAGWGECRAVCIGAAGITNPETRSVIGEAAGLLGGDCKLLLMGDQEIALYGACGGESGAILIAGTGSICMGRDQKGRSCRAGGFGHLIDDEGSGYALGRDALCAVVRAFDGRRDHTVLTRLIMEEWKASGIEELVRQVYAAPDKSHMAALAPLVERAGRMGDDAAMAVIDKGATGLLELVLTVQRKLSLQHMSLSLMGGLLVADTLLRQRVLALLARQAPDVELRQPLADGAAGAAMLAVREATQTGS